MDFVCRVAVLAVLPVVVAAIVVHFVYLMFKSKSNEERMQSLVNIERENGSAAVLFYI